MTDADANSDSGAAFETEIEHGHADYTAEELLEQAQANAQALIIATLAFLDARGLPVADWAEAVGATFGRGWDDPRPWDPGEFLDAMLTNYRALGALVVAVDLGPGRAEATLTGFPDPDLCAVFGVAPDRVARFHDVAAPIARARGLVWSWDVDADQTRLVVTAAG